MPLSFFSLIFFYIYIFEEPDVMGVDNIAEYFENYIEVPLGKLNRHL